MNDTQFQIDHLIELAVLQRAELKTLVDSMPQLRDHLSEEIERNIEEAEPAIRSELEQLVIARAKDAHAESSATLNAKIEELAKALEITTAAKYSVLMAERAENANLLAKAEARIEDAASMLSHAVKEIVTDELSRFPRAGEIDQLRKEFAEPRGLNPRGRWMPDETYQRLDLVTINGDSFVSNIDGNRERPSRTAGDWTLSAARGNGGGGGGVTTMTDLVPVPSNGQLLIGNGSAFVNSTLTAGTGISISNGAGSITINATDGNITLDDGTAAAPSLNFTNEPTTGLFRASANVMGFAVAGTSRATMTATGMTVTGTITPTGSVHAAAGSLGNPSIAFNADQNTGLYNIGPDNIGVVANGAKVLDIATTGLGVTGTLSVSGVATLGAGAILNTPASGTLTNATGLPISTGVSGLGANVAAFLATPSSANLAAALTDETGTGANVFATSPTLTTPISATLTSPAGNNLTLGTGTSGAAVTVLSASNNVGIGTTSPAKKFEVSTTDATQIRIGYGSASALYTYDIGRSNSTGYLNFTANEGTNDYGFLFNNGKVGIGTTSPAHKLQVGSTSDAGTNLIRIATNTSGTQGISFLRSGSIETVLAVVSQKLQYAINPASSSDSDLIAASKFTIDNAGITTIANTTAGSSGAGALVVAGGISAAGASYFGGAVGFGITPNASYPVYVSSADGTVTTSRLNNSSTGNARLLIDTSGVGDPIINFATSATDWAMGIDNSVSGDPFVLAATSTLGTASNVLSITTAGAATFGGSVSVSGESLSISGANPVITNTATGSYNVFAMTTSGGATKALAFLSTESGVSQIRSEQTSIRDYNGTTTYGVFSSTGLAVTGALSTTGAATFAGTVSPQQATTAAAPSYVKGAIYFDTTLNKLRVGGATAWETITSV